MNTQIRQVELVDLLQANGGNAAVGALLILPLQKVTGVICSFWLSLLETAEKGGITACDLSTCGEILNLS